MEVILQFIQENLQWFILGIAIVIALIPFGVGFKKGFRKMSWAGWIWGGTAVAVYFLRELLWNLEFVQNFLGGLPLGEKTRAFFFTLVLTLVIVLVVMIVVGIFGAIVRPRKKKAPTEYQKAVAVEKERVACLDLDEDEILARKRRKERPCFINRLFGGIFNLVNFAVVLAAIAAVAAIILNVTPLKDGALKPVFENEIFKLVWQYISVYTWDFLLIGFVLAMAYSGYKVGVACGLYSLIKPLGFIALIAVSFWLPFTNWAVEGPLSFLMSFSKAIASIIPAMVPANIALIIGAIGVGLVLAVILCVVWGLLLLAFKALINKSLKRPFWSFIDGIIGVVIRLIIGVLIAGIIITLLYVIQYLGVDMGAFISAESPILGGAFEMLEAYLKPILDKLMAMGV